MTGFENRLKIGGVHNRIEISELKISGETVDD